MIGQQVRDKTQDPPTTILFYSWADQCAPKTEIMRFLRLQLRISIAGQKSLRFPALKQRNIASLIPLSSLFGISLLCSFCDFPCFSGRATPKILGKESKNVPQEQEKPQKHKIARKGGSGVLKPRISIASDCDLSLRIPSENHTLGALSILVSRS